MNKAPGQKISSGRAIDRPQRCEACKAHRAIVLISIDSVALGDIGQPFPGSPTLDGLCALIIGKLRLPTELHASGHGPLTAVARTIADLFHL